MPRFVVNPRWTELPDVMAVLHGFPRDYAVHDYRTTLSIKSVARGSARYATHNGRYLVVPEVFLVLNHDQRYSMAVEAESGTETLCPFFARGFVERAAGSLAAGDARQLDDAGAPAVPVELCERLYPKRGPVADILAELRAPCDATTLEDRFHDLALALLALRDDTRREMATFPALRRATREELYRRLHRARDFLWSCYAEPIGVADAARAAALSPFHFHRSFRRAFGMTPMRLLQRRRLEVARRLLEDGQPVTEVAAAVGFASLGSFSALFRRAYGLAPRELKKQG